MDKPYSVTSWLYRGGSFHVAIRGGAWRYRRWLAFRNVGELEALIDKLWGEFKNHLKGEHGRPFSSVVRSRSVRFSNVDALDHLIEELRRECKSLLREAVKKGTTQAA